MTTYSDDTMEMALALWPQYTKETLPPQIYITVANRLVKERRDRRKAVGGSPRHSTGA